MGSLEGVRSRGVKVARRKLRIGLVGTEAELEELQEGGRMAASEERRSPESMNCQLPSYRSQSTGPEHMFTHGNLFSLGRPGDAVLAIRNPFRGLVFNIGLVFLHPRPLVVHVSLAVKSAPGRVTAESLPLGLLFEMPLGHSSDVIL